uniref:Helicase POLQ-like n=1 Tax=Trichuris muris TaxID=70415 RepID=A0A5S6QKW7_TRIMR
MNVQANSQASSQSDEVNLPPEVKRTRTLQSKLRERFEQNAVRLEPEEASFHGLPHNVKTRFKELRGVTQLYDWQDEVLNCPAIRTGQNLIISLPTGGGKTLLSEILILKQIICRNKDVLFVLPYVSIVQEKVKDFIPLGLELNFLVEEYAASKGRIPPIKRRRKKSVYVATIERAQTLANSLYENKRIDDLGLVVIDEFHLIGEGGGRGSSLEQLIVKLKFCSPACQLIGMSATLSNLEHLKTFMNADLFIHQFRPISLTEYVKLDQLVYKVDTNSQDPREVLVFYRRLESGSAIDPDNLSELVTEVVPSGSCLIFCPTKKSAENVCLLLTKVLPSELREHKKQERTAFFKRLIQECDGRICNVQKQCIPYGLAYHHSGLTADERRLIQDAFLEGILCVLCCTSTLAAGVNLPAKRVILRTFTVGNRFMSKQEYKQMTGRAGRAGKDDNGESIAVAHSAQKSQIEELLCSNFEACKSSLLYDNGRGLKNLLLSTIGLQMIKCKADIVQIVKLTLLYVQCKESEQNEINGIVQHALTSLLNEKLICMKGEEVVTTRLGAAVCKGGIDIDISRSVHANLLTSLRNMVLVSHFHLLYCVAPYSVQYHIFLDWNVFYDEFSSLTEVEKTLLRSLGINEQFLIMRRKGTMSSSKVMDLTLVQRVFFAFILRRIWNKENIWEVADRFNASRGAIQQLVHSALGFASSLCRFVEHLDELWAFRSLLPDFIKAFQFNVTAELIPLMEIHGVQRARARQLYKAGYKSVANVANADAASLVKDVQNLHKGTAHQIIRSAKMLLHEKMEGLLESVEAMLATDNAADFSLEDIVATLRISV